MEALIPPGRVGLPLGLIAPGPGSTQTTLTAKLCQKQIGNGPTSEQHNSPLAAKVCLVPGNLHQTVALCNLEF